MMDDKYLAEIKARCEAFKKSGENYGVVFPEQIRSVLLDDGYEEQWSDLAAHASLDVNALLAEVERLNAYESIDLLPEQIEAMQGHNIALIEENAAKDQQIATLETEKKRAEKALELACEDQTEHCPYTLHGGKRVCSEYPMRGLRCQGCAPAYYIHQAKEQEGRE